MRSNPLPLPHALASQLAQHVFVRNRLLADIPDLDSQTLRDTLEGISDLKELISALIRSVLDDEALTDGLSARIQDMKARLDRLETRARKKRDLALRAMCDGDIPKIIEPDFTASLRVGVATLDIIAEDAIPEAFWKPQPAKLDRAGLIAALKGGLKTNAAKLSESSLQLSVRTK